MNEKRKVLHMDLIFLADKHFNKVWRELILADPKKNFLREEILADFVGF